ncbi:hypothetical protein [Pelagivirga sediminicola]|nr:hypothetical protein [Pelagivirga sediminicola]
MKNYVLAAAVAVMPMAASAVTIELDSTFGPGSNAGMLYSTGSGF